MSKDTNIEWCDSTVNPTSGCDGCELYSPKNPGAAICYARAIHETRFAYQGALQASGNYAKSFSEVRMIAGRLLAAAYWTDLRGKDRIGKPWLTGRPRCIFVGDLSDIFSAAVTDQYLEDEVFGVMEMPAARRHVWMVLTKRPSRLADFSEKRAARNGYGLPRNCIAMTSVTSQATANARIPHLLRTRTRWRGISAEPLFESVTLARLLPAGWAGDHLDWVIVGGASGAHAVPFNLAWAQGLVDECRCGGIACFVKQLGSDPYQQSVASDVGAVSSHSMRLHHKKGGDPAEWPASIAVREVPAFELQEVVSTTEVSD